MVAACCAGTFIIGAALVGRYSRRNRDSQFVSGKVPLWVVILCLTIPCAVYLVWLLGRIMP
jgi:hypothetical protein